MSAMQPVYDYSAYEYPYDRNIATAYSSYPGYESSALYAAPGSYENYPTGATTEQSYISVDPYTGCATTAYSYPNTDPTSTDAKPSNSSQIGYASSYSSSQVNASYENESNNTPPLSERSSNPYATYNYDPNMNAACATKSSSTDSYLPGKDISTANVLSSSNNYDVYATSTPSSHMYSSTIVDMIPRQFSYYPSNQIPHSMQYVHQQSQRMPYRLPPRGGYQRELDEPGDENDLLRHVIYITGLPKEILNDTLAEVFGATCGLIAPVDVRSPKPKIWVYKDRQTREGKGEATITFINPESCQLAINYFNGKELFGREIRITLCPRRMYNMQKQNTPFNPAAPPMNAATSISSMIKPTINDNNSNNNLTEIAKTTATTGITSSNIVTGANPIATISSSTFGLPRQINHSLFKLRQTSDQQRGLLSMPHKSSISSMMNNTFQRDGTRKEFSRVVTNKSNTSNMVPVRPKPY